MALTPGPWWTEHTHFIGGDVQVFGADPTLDYPVARVFGGLRLHPENAALIAAAPDLYAALQAVNKLVSEAATTGFNWQDGDWAQRLFDSQQETSRALAKARPAQEASEVGK